MARYGPEGVPSVDSLRRYRARYLPNVMVLPPKLVQDKLKGVDYKVDLINELATMVPLFKERICRGLATEEEKFGGMLLASTDMALRGYLELLREYRATAQDLGLLPRPPAPVIDMRNQTLVVSQGSKEELQQIVRELLAMGYEEAKKMMPAGLLEEDS